MISFHTCYTKHVKERVGNSQTLSSTSLGEGGEKEMLIDFQFVFFCNPLLHFNNKLLQPLPLVQSFKHFHNFSVTPKVNIKP